MIRALAVVALLLTSTGLAHAADPASGALDPTPGAKLAWAGTGTGGTNPGPQLGDHDLLCVEGTNCDTYVLTLSGTPADWSGLAARLIFRWGSPTHDYDIYVHKGSPDGPVAADSGKGPTNFEQTDIDPAEDGTGVFYVHVVYFLGGSTDQYSATVTTVASAAATLLPAPVDPGPRPGYQTHGPSQEQLAAGLTRNTQDEPNIGVNWETGNVMFQTLMQTSRVAFDDASCPQTPASTWTNVSPVTAQQSFDPILFTDHQTNRTFVHHLLLNPLTNPTAFTDDDGATWLPSQGAGPGSGVDHQTLGGGPFHAPVPSGLPPYGHSVYYCAQDIAFANCALSVDGGVTFGPAVPIYTLEQCAGLHGHVKVGPDGTAYVPNASCVGLINPNENGIAVSEDNGVTWTVRTLPGSVGAGGSDPSVAVDDGGRLYMGFVNNDDNPAVAVSDDHGRTWQNVYDVGHMVGVRSATFPAMVAGGPGRAAMAFYGTTAEGDANGFGSHGEWYLFVAHTYDGGESWVTVNATPNDPLQRGGIHLGGGGSVHRNLLDFFDADLDAQGRMVVGYADGCVGTCAQAGPGARGNSYTAFGRIARQTSGRRLFATFDQVGATVPGAPAVTVTRNGNTATLSWSTSEDGGSPITGYQVVRAPAGGSEQLLASLSGTTTRYVDASAAAGTTWTYRVSATNAVGTSCGTNAVTAPPAGSSCGNGVRIATDAVGDQKGAPLLPDMDVEWVNVGEPRFEDGSSHLVFTMKVGSLASLAPNRAWRIQWKYPDGPADTDFVGKHYVGMNTDLNGAVSFEHGTIGELSAVVADGAPVTIRGAADPESSYDPDGTIRIVVSPSKIGSPEPGDLVGGLVARTYPVRQDVTARSDSAADSVTAYDTYALVGPAACAPPAPTCLGEADAAVAYSSGWHSVAHASASGGTFRVHPGKSGQGSLRLTVDVPSGNGSVVYSYGRSTKGGSAQLYVDGALHSTVDYSGPSGKLETPELGAELTITGLAAGAHTIELRNVVGAAYVDGFCVQGGAASGTSPTGPGTTTSALLPLASLGSVLKAVSVPAGATSLSAVATGTGLLRLVAIDPAGAVLATADAVNGVATLEVPVSRTGLFQLKVVNLAVGGTSAWVAGTPYGSR
jgi:hypothetical protein